MNIVDIIEKDDVTLSVRVESPEGRCALLNIHRPSLKDVHQRQPVRAAETSAAVVHDGVSADVFCGDLIHATTAWKNSDYIKDPLLSHKQKDRKHLQNITINMPGAELSMLWQMLMLANHQNKKHFPKCNNLTASFVNPTYELSKILRYFPWSIMQYKYNI